MRSAALLCLLVVALLARGHEALEACTIGVAAGDDTTRALLWKVRDAGLAAEEHIGYAVGDRFGFVYVWDGLLGSDRMAWMGANDSGFAVVNANVTASRADSIGNGQLMFRALGSCGTIEEFQTLVDTLDLVDHSLHANFAMIDSTGAAAVFEVSSGLDSFYREDVDTFAVRVNSYLYLGTDGEPRPDTSPRYRRSRTHVQELRDDGRFDYRALLQEHMRDLSDSESLPVDVPYPRRWQSGRPYGYIYTGHSICRDTSHSAAVIRGVLPGEPPYLTTMWTILGNPAAGIAVPTWPVEELRCSEWDSLREVADGIRERLYDDVWIRYVDSYRLRNDVSNGARDLVFPAESSIMSITEDWVFSDAHRVDLGAFQCKMASRALAELRVAAGVIDSIGVVADFAVSDTVAVAGEAVSFEDRSLHNPTTREWRFGDHTRQDEADPSHVYSLPGTYSVRLSVADACGSATSTKTVALDVVRALEVAADTPASCASEPALSHLSVPGPIGREAAVHYVLPAAAEVDLRVYDVSGRLVRTLVRSPRAGGHHEVVWDGKDERGREVPSGIYFLRMEAGERVETARTVLIR